MTLLRPSADALYRWYLRNYPVDTTQHNPMKPNQENRKPAMDRAVIHTTPATTEGNPPNVEVRTNRDHTELALIRTGDDPQAGSGMYVLLDDEQTRELTDALAARLDGKYVTPPEWLERLQEEHARELAAYQDRVDTLTSDLDEARAEERERTLERDAWESVALGKDELNLALREHLETVQGQAADWKGLQIETAGELNAAVGQLHRVEQALEAMRTPQRTMSPDLATLFRKSPTVEGDLKLQGSDNMVTNLDPWRVCGHISPEGLGGEHQPPRRCTVNPGDRDNHRTFPDGRMLHTDGVYVWTPDGDFIASADDDWGLDPESRHR